MQYNYQHPVYAKDSKDIPERLKIHRWLPPLDFNKLSELLFKVRMSCPKCEEKVVEEIWEVPGVFDVRASWTMNKVVVTAMPWPIGLDEDEVLRKAKKIDCKARLVKQLDLNKSPPPERAGKPPMLVTPKPVDKEEKEPQPKPASKPARPTEFHYPPEHYHHPPASSPYPPEFHRYPSEFHRTWPADGTTPFYFLLLLLLLMFFFLKF